MSVTLSDKARLVRNSLVWSSPSLRHDRLANWIACSQVYCFGEWPRNHVTSFVTCPAWWAWPYHKWIHISAFRSQILSYNHGVLRNNHMASVLIKINELWRVGTSSSNRNHHAFEQNMMNHGPDELSHIVYIHQRALLKSSFNATN